eukprot:363239-Chlamydomonas_euryale.AAC.6
MQRSLRWASCHEVENPRARMRRWRCVSSQPGCQPRPPAFRQAQGHVLGIYLPRRPRCPPAIPGGNFTTRPPLSP